MVVTGDTPTRDGESADVWDLYDPMTQIAIWS
jgi:hypothetical protein